MEAVHSAHSAIFDAQPRRKLKPSFWFALSLALALHGILAAYLINEKFSVVLPPSPPETITTVDFEPLPKPEEPKPVKTTTPPPTPLTPRPPLTPAPDSVDPLPIPPVKDPVVSDGKTPPIITEPVVTPGPATQPAPPAYVTARWTRFPDSEALLDYYPKRAEEDEIEGKATLECTVADAKGRVSCIVLSETPKGYDFGKATVAMVQKEGRVDTSQGDVRIGSKLRTIVKWTLN